MVQNISSKPWDRLFWCRRSYRWGQKAWCGAGRKGMAVWGMDSINHVMSTMSKSLDFWQKTIFQAFMVWLLIKKWVSEKLRCLSDLNQSLNGDFMFNNIVSTISEHCEQVLNKVIQNLAIGLDHSDIWAFQKPIFSSKVTSWTQEK